MKYDAFISYSHRKDRGVARQLQQSLESFAKPLFRRRSMRVFRDTTNLEATPDLWGKIVQALDQSQFFVLLASPDSARSPWVEREIEHYLEADHRSSICIVLTSGKLPWTDPRALPGNAECGISPQVYELFRTRRQEPLVIDIQKHRGPSGHLKTRSSAYQGEIASLAAAILERDKDELYGEHITRQRRFRMSVGVIICLLLGLTGFGWFTSQQARDKQSLAHAKQAAQLATEARRLSNESGDGQLAILLALESMLVRLRAGEPPPRIAHRAILEVLDRQGKVPRLVPRNQDRGTGIDTVESLCFSDDGRWLYGKPFLYGVRRWELHLDSKVVVRPGEQSGYQLIPEERKQQKLCDGAVTWSHDGRWLATTNSADNVARIWRITDRGEPAGDAAKLEIKVAQKSEQVLGISKTGCWLAIRGPASGAGAANAVGLWHPDSGTPSALLATLKHDSPVTAIAFSHDEHWLATATTTSVRLWSLSPEPDEARYLVLSPPEQISTPKVNGLALSADSRWLAAAAKSGAFLWNIQKKDASRQTDLSSRADEIVLPDAMAPLAETPSLDGSSQVARLLPHGQRVDVVDFSADTQWLLTGGPEDNDVSARLWSLLEPDSDPVVLINDKRYGGDTSNRDMHVISSAFSRDGRWLALATRHEGSILIWPMVIEEWINLGCRAVERSFKPEEWSDYFEDEEFDNVGRALGCLEPLIANRI